jgi:hypothetical protein
MTSNVELTKSLYSNSLKLPIHSCALNSSFLALTDEALRKSQLLVMFNSTYVVVLIICRMKNMLMFLTFFQILYEKEMKGDDV